MVNTSMAQIWNYMEYPEYEKFFKAAGYDLIDHYYRPQGWPREEQRWLAIVAKKL